MSDYLDIRDFGAVGDGIADDTQALLAAMDAARGKGIVFFSAGTYAVRPVRVPAHIVLMGRSNGSGAEKCTTLRALPGEGDALLMLREAAGTRVFGLTLDGALAGPAMSGISIFGGKHLCAAVEDCEIRGFSGHGVTVQNADAYAIRRCRIASAGGHGIALTDSSRGVIIDCIAEDQAGAGVHSQGGRTEGTTIVCLRAERSLAGGVVMKDASMAQINGCIFSGCGRRAVHLQNCAGVSVTGCLASGSEEGVAVNGGREIAVTGNVVAAPEDTGHGVALDGAQVAVAVVNAPEAVCGRVLTDAMGQSH